MYETLIVGLTGQTDKVSGIPGAQRATSAPGVAFLAGSAARPLGAAGGERATGGSCSRGVVLWVCSERSDSGKRGGKVWRRSLWL